MELQMLMSCDAVQACRVRALEYLQVFSPMRCHCAIVVLLAVCGKLALAVPIVRAQGKVSHRSGIHNAELQRGDGYSRDPRVRHSHRSSRRWTSATNSTSGGSHLLPEQHMYAMGATFGFACASERSTNLMLVAHIGELLEEESHSPRMRALQRQKQSAWRHL